MTVQIKQTEHVNSYYAATQKQALNLSPFSQPKIHTKVCIIGGGYAGLMTAMSLLERGVKEIVIIEKNKVGWGASGRNGGFVFGGYSLGPRALVKRVGQEKAKALYQFTTQAVDLIRQRINRYQIHCDLVDEGVIWANWFKDQSLLLEEQAFMRKMLQVEWKYLTPEQLSKQIMSKRYHGGLFEKNAMHFHPLNYANGIAHKIIQSGAQLYEATPAKRVKKVSGGSVVETESGEIHCEHLVIAAGGYIENLYPKVASSILPIATYVMATEPLADRLEAVLKTKAAVYDTRFAFDYYRPLPDSSLLWGGRISANTKRPKDLEQDLKNDVYKVFPDLGDFKVDYAWEGWMAYSRHQMAQIGQVDSNVWYGIGFGGHGVAPTTAAGEILASAICGDNSAIQQFKPWGLPWNGGVFGPIAAQVSYAWYQARDWLKQTLE
ncbi:NAD(P)/FAD-dependent oxidoreductase [Aliikangiella sp. IMCC44632]